MKVLLVEDDPAVSRLFADVLRHHRYTVDLAYDGGMGWALATQGSYDAILLDILMPGLDGLSFCRRLRQQGDKTPLLMITGCDRNEDIVAGLDAGADDYLIKPCEPAQMVARIRAVTRRAETGNFAGQLTWGDLVLDPLTIRVTYQQQPVVLSPKEYALLELFLRQPQRIFTRDAIIDALWTIDDTPSPAAVTNLVKDLRRKLKGAGLDTNPVRTIHRIGYRLEEAPEPRPAEAPPLPEEGLQLLRRATVDFAASLDNRLTALEAAASAGFTPDASEGWQRLRDIAHSLAGALGTFGYPQGLNLAREIERLGDAVLEGYTPEPTAQDKLPSLLAALRTAVVEQTPNQPAAKSLPWVAVIDAPSQWLAALQTAAAQWPLRIHPLELQQISSSLPAVTICYWQGEDSPQTLAQALPGVPLLVIVPADDLNTRIAVSRSLSQTGISLQLLRYLTLPVSPQQVLTTVALMIDKRVRSQAMVMVVDDDPTFLRAITGMLQIHGLQVDAIADPRLCWQRLQQAPPDLLLMDISMPNFNGLDLCRVIRQDSALRHLPVLMVSGHQDPHTQELAFAAGAEDFITKPISSAEVVRRILNRLERAVHQQPV